MRNIFTLTFNGLNGFIFQKIGLFMAEDFVIIIIIFDEVIGLFQLT